MKEANTIEEIRAKMLELEAQKIRMEAKTNTAKVGSQPKTPAFQTKEAEEETIIIKKAPIADQTITKQIASEEINRELKTDKPYLIGGIVGFLLVYGVSILNTYIAGVIALIGVSALAIRLAQITKKSNYLKQKYGV